ncbi:hypothetical protein I311_06981 [Cryptococcus gattii NT-10]|nr:hypothetical protein I311_06981 [Cryptococcus gattii NT-10]
MGTTSVAFEEMGNDEILSDSRNQTIGDVMIRSQ